MNCKKCGNAGQKWGRQKTGNQRFYCKECRKTWHLEYVYRAAERSINKQIVELVKESVGIRGISRVLKIALATVINRIRQIARNIRRPAVPLNRRSFEMDELRTYVGKKENQYWVAYALCSGPGRS